MNIGKYYSLTLSIDLIILVHVHVFTFTQFKLWGRIGIKFLHVAVSWDRQVLSVKNVKISKLVFDRNKLEVDALKRATWMLGFQLSNWEGGAQV